MELVSLLIDAAYPADAGCAAACRGHHQPGLRSQAFCLSSHPNHLLRDPYRQSAGLE